MDRSTVLDRLTAARSDRDQAEARLTAAEALDWVTSHQVGLWYAPVDATEALYVVACNGQVIGWISRGEGNHLLRGWTAAPFSAGDGPPLGPFHTGRAAAAALARACGMSPSSSPDAPAGALPGAPEQPG